MTSFIVREFAVAIVFRFETLLTRSLKPRASTITSTRFGLGDS